jgi:hypothetical protein
MFVILAAEEYDDVGQRKLLTASQANALEQEQAHQGKTSTATKTRLVDQNSTAVGGANA